RVRTHQFNKARRGNTSGIDAMLPHDHHAFFKAGHSIGDFGEIALAEFLTGAAVCGVLCLEFDPITAIVRFGPFQPGAASAFKPEVAVIGTDMLQRAVFDGLPQYTMIVSRADRR